MGGRGTDYEEYLERNEGVDQVQIYTAISPERNKELSDMEEQRAEGVRLFHELIERGYDEETAAKICAEKKNIFDLSEYEEVTGGNGLFVHTCPNCESKSFIFVSIPCKDENGWNCPRYNGFCFSCEEEFRPEELGICRCGEPICLDSEFGLCKTCWENELKR